MDVNALSPMVTLYGGEFLDGFSLSDSPDFETCLLEKRAYYRSQVIQALLILVGRCEQEERYELGLIYSRRALEIEPWLEEVHQQVMRMLALNGQRTEALAQYEICRQQLEREFGV